MTSVKIYTIHYNRPEFIRWQYDSFNKFLKHKDGIELIVVNNARDKSLRDEIDSVCADLNLQTIHTFSERTLPGHNHSDSLNHVWKNYIVKDDFAIFCDGDVFMVKDFDIELFMGDNVLAGAYQHREQRYEYLTPVVIISKPNQMPNAGTLDWEGIGVNDVRLDTGGGLYNYFLEHPEVKQKTKNLVSSWHIKEDNKNMHCIPDELSFMYDSSYNIEFFGNEFLHYCRSSNWDNQTEAHHMSKANFVENFVYGCINENIKAKDHNFQIVHPSYFGWQGRT